MNADRFFPKIVAAFILILTGTLSACAPAATPTYFRPPSDTTPLPTARPVEASPVVIPTLTFSISPTEATSPTPPCTDNLTFLNDLTYPDGTVVLPGTFMDKQWLVQNAGTCDWNDNYHLRFVGGDQLGAPDEILLYPARAGARVTLQVTFTAPLEAGSYQSAWQAEGPDGTLFGDTVFVLITVAPY